MGNFNDMQPCAHCGQVRNTAGMACKNGLWVCAHHAMDPAALARMAEDHTKPEPDRWPSGWWLVAASVASGVIWWWLFKSLGWL